MKKYFQIFHLALQEYFVYRLSFVMWRVRSLISFLVLLFFWLAVYADRSNFAGYEKSQMFTYVIGVAFLRGLIFATRSEALASWIRDGGLNIILVRPLSVFKVLMSRDLADKLMNVGFVILEIILVSEIFNLTLFMPNTYLVVIYSIIFVALAFCLNFFISIVISLTAFWTDDIWAVRFLFGVIFLEFFSGALFPIDILPAGLKTVLSWTPFPYIVYFPIKVWLGQINGPEIAKVIAICVGWTFVFVWLAKTLWNKGYKEYGAYGG